MYTVGPAMSFRTSCCVLLQNEHFSILSGDDSASSEPPFRKKDHMLIATNTMRLSRCRIKRPAGRAFSASVLSRGLGCSVLLMGIKCPNEKVLEKTTFVACEIASEPQQTEAECEHHRKHDCPYPCVGVLIARTEKNRMNSV